MQVQYASRLLLNGLAHQKCISDVHIRYANWPSAFMGCVMLVWRATALFTATRMYVLICWSASFSVYHDSCCTLLDHMSFVRCVTSVCASYKGSCGMSRQAHELGRTLVWDWSTCSVLVHRKITNLYSFLKAGSGTKLLGLCGRVSWLIGHEYLTSCVGFNTDKHLCGYWFASINAS